MNYDQMKLCHDVTKNLPSREILDAVKQASNINTDIARDALSLGVSARDALGLGVSARDALGLVSIPPQFIEIANLGSCLDVFARDVFNIAAGPIFQLAEMTKLSLDFDVYASSAALRIVNTKALYEPFLQDVIGMASIKALQECSIQESIGSVSAKAIQDFSLQEAINEANWNYIQEGYLEDDAGKTSSDSELITMKDVENIAKRIVDKAAVKQKMKALKKKVKNLEKKMMVQTECLFILCFMLNTSRPISADVNQNKKERLVNLLLECPSIMDTENRNILIKELPFQNAIKMNHDARFHVLNIVNTCLNHANGLYLLINRIRFFDEKTNQFKVLDKFINEQFIEKDKGEDKPDKINGVRVN